jgi:hypothetical protein
MTDEELIEKKLAFIETCLQQLDSLAMLSACFVQHRVKDRVDFRVEAARPEARVGLLSSVHWHQYLLSLADPHPDIQLL